MNAATLKEEDPWSCDDCGQFEESLVHAKRFEYDNFIEIAPRELYAKDINDLSAAQEEAMRRRHDRLMDETKLKDVRFMPGGMTAWYLVESIAMTDTCYTIAEQMRTTRGYHEKLTSPEFLALELETKKRHYNKTIESIWIIHKRYQDEVKDIIGIDNDNIAATLPACVKSHWRSKRSKYA